MIEERKSCLECGTAIIGRSDKIYCSDYCRANHHNQRNRKRLKIVREINRILSSNRKVLAEFHRKKVYLIPNDDLLAAGFKPNFQTGWIQNEKGLIISKCYDFAFEKISPEFYKIYKPE